MTSGPDIKQTGLRSLFLRGFAWTFVQSVGGLVVQVVTLVVLSRLLTPADFGVVAVAVSLIGCVSLVVELGVGPALVQRRELTLPHVGSAIWLSLLLAAILMALLQYLAPVITGWLGIAGDEAVFRFLSVIIVLQPMITILSSLARRNLEMRDAATADLIGSALGYSAISIALALASFGYWALAIGQISQLVLTLCVLLISQRRKLSLRAGRGALADVLSFGAYFSIGRLANYAAQKFDRALVGTFLGVEAAGNYQRVLNMLQMVGPLLSGPLDAIMFPLLSRIQDDSARLRRSYRASTAVAALLTMPVSVLMCVSAPVMVPLVLGSQWYGLILPAQIMSGLLFFRTNDSITATLSRARGSVKERAALQVLYAALSLGSIYLLKDLGLAGIAAGLLAVTILNFILMSFLVRHITTMTMADNFGPLLPGLAVALSLAALAGLFYLCVGGELFTLKWMVLYLLASAVLYIASVIAIPGALLPTEVRGLRAELIQKVADRLRPWRPSAPQLEAADPQA